MAESGHRRYQQYDCLTSLGVFPCSVAFKIVTRLCRCFLVISNRFFNCTTVVVFLSICRGFLLLLLLFDGASFSSGEIFLSILDIFSASRC